MLHLKLAFLAAVGGALGSSARYLAGAAALRMFGPAFPWATLFVNVAGSFAMGVVAGLAIHRAAINPDMRVFLATGILGGFTTFSAFALDTVFLSDESASLAIAYIAASVALSIAALYFGFQLTK